MVGAKLVVIGGQTAYTEMALELPAVIGRSNDCDITVPEPLVSRKHCEIYDADGRLRVRDLGSLNGTFVGRERIEDEELLPGDLLTIGTVTFRAVYDDWSESDGVDKRLDSSHVLSDSVDATARDTASASLEETELQKDGQPVSGVAAANRTPAQPTATDAGTEYPARD